MKKIFATFFVFILSYLPVFSHPLDISVSTATIKSNSLFVTSYFHSYEIEYLLRENNINPKDIGDYYIHENILKKELQKNISVVNNRKQCRFKNYSPIDLEPYEILSDGFGVTFEFECEDLIEKINFTNKMFINFPLQTNRITFYKPDTTHKIKPIYFQVLTAKIYDLFLDTHNINTNSIDTDNDGPSDKEENIYATNQNKADSDGDYYSDKEEVDGGWNPLNPELGPGQEFREPNEGPSQEMQKNNFDNIDDTVYTSNLSDYGQNNDFLKKVLKYINDYFRGDTRSLWVVFGIVFLLGVLHAAGPGHGKALLMAYTLEKENGYKKGILYAGIFTLTHILDIIALFLVSQLLFAYIDTSKYVYYIQLISAIILFILSLYLIYKRLSSKKIKKTTKPTLAVAFLSGLAPCSFAWSIYLLLLALGKSYWIIPLVIALGIGIFTLLILVVLITVFLKNKTYKKLDILEKYSSWFSLSIILTMSIVLLYKLI